MKILYSETLDGICIQRCFGLDGNVRLPESVAGRTVTRLAPYVFSDSMERAVRFKGGFTEPLWVWDCDGGTAKAAKAPDTEALDGLSAVCGGGVTGLELPAGVRAVGAYAFYGCENLERLECASTLLDWGAGVFTGCTGLGRLGVRMIPGEKSCLREILSELHQALRVDLKAPDGALKARLIFPEFYEESVENTPARIIMREMHGCGHMYRYCFDGANFDFKEYDRLFAHALVQEPEEAAARMALYRLCWPEGLSGEAEALYRAFIRKNPGPAARAALADRDFNMAARVADEADGRPALEAMIAEAGARGDAQALALFMDRLHRLFGTEKTARKKFAL